jgi:bifunctional DNA-binding transcriptional regulator/antitoxin component of YhaV-PrlF toxin-antitoxin module
MNEIIGLPAVVSTCHRIVIDKNLRELHGLPETGSVLMLINKDRLQIFSRSASVEGAMVKEISIGRFNLPIDWARANGVKVGDRVYLVATDDCILVCPSVRKEPEIGQMKGMTR